MEIEWEGQWVELGLALEERRIDPPRDILPCDAGQLLYGYIPSRYTWIVVCICRSPPFGIDLNIGMFYIFHVFLLK